VDGAGFAVSLV